MRTPKEDLPGFVKKLNAFSGTFRKKQFGVRKIIYVMSWYAPDFHIHIAALLSSITPKTPPKTFDRKLRTIFNYFAKRGYVWKPGWTHPEENILLRTNGKHFFSTKKMTGIRAIFQPQTIPSRIPCFFIKDQKSRCNGFCLKYAIALNPTRIVHDAKKILRDTARYTTIKFKENYFDCLLNHESSHWILAKKFNFNERKYWKDSAGRPLQPDEVEEFIAETCSVLAQPAFELINGFRNMMITLSENPHYFHHPRHHPYRYLEVFFHRFFQKMLQKKHVNLMKLIRKNNTSSPTNFPKNYQKMYQLLSLFEEQDLTMLQQNMQRESEKFLIRLRKKSPQKHS